RAVAEVVGARAGAIGDVVVARRGVDRDRAAGRGLARVDAGVGHGDSHADAGAGGRAGGLTREPAIVAVVVEAVGLDPGEPDLRVVFGGVEVRRAAVGERARSRGTGAAGAAAGRVATVAAAAPGQHGGRGDACGDQRGWRKVVVSFRPGLFALRLLGVRKARGDGERQDRHGLFSHVRSLTAGDSI